MFRVFQFRSHYLGNLTISEDCYHPPTIIIRRQTSDNMVYTEKHISIIGVIAGSHYSSHRFI
ncbi:hypothetical protein D3100_24080 [Escherichia coli]|nr:hypothetical protein [Escherichia coli]